MVKRTLRVVISLALMAVLLAVFLWNVNLAEVGDALERADFAMVAASILVALVSYWFRAIRWQLILRPVATFRHSSAVLATAVGYAAMTLLPARMGDLVRPIVLSRRERLPVSATLASILTERIFDLFTVVFFFLVFVAWPPSMPGLNANVLGEMTSRFSKVPVIAALIVGVVGLFGVFRYQDSIVELVTSRVARIRKSWQQPVVNFLNHFIDGLRVLQRPFDLIITTASSLFIWYLIYWQVKLILLAFGLDFPLRAGFVIVAMTVVGLAVPTPGGVGGFHAATKFALMAVFGVEENLSAAVAIAYWAICFVPITLIGLLCLPLVGFRLREVESLDMEADES